MLGYQIDAQESIPQKTICISFIEIQKLGSLWKEGVRIPALSPTDLQKKVPLEERAILNSLIKEEDRFRKREKLHASSSYAKIHIDIF